MLFKRKGSKKELTLEELQFIEEQRMKTEELFYKVVKYFEENKNQESVFFAPFQSWDMRLYLSNLFRKNLIDENYMKKLCKLYNLDFTINFEIEGDYPTIYFFKMSTEDKKLEKTK